MIRWIRASVSYQNAISQHSADEGSKLQVFSIATQENESYLNSCQAICLSPAKREREKNVIICSMVALQSFEQSLGHGAMFGESDFERTLIIV
jgi:hypothetical protein